MVRGLKSRLKMLSRVFVRNRFLLSVGLSVASGLVARSVIQIPDSDALLRYAAFERPAMYQAFIVSYAPFLFTTPFLLLSMCLSLAYIHFYQEQIQQAAGLTPPYPKPEFRKQLFLILGELHEQIEPVPAAHPKWLNIPERGLYTGIAALGAIGSGKTRELILPAMRQLFGYEAQDSEKKLSGIVLEVKGDLCRHLRRITDATLQYRAHSLLVQPFITFAVEHFFSDEFGEPPDLEWFHHEGCDRAKLGRKESVNVFRIQTNQKSTSPLPLHARH